MSTASSHPPVSVALGGGGAKGVLHIGVLKAIVEQHLQIRSLVGTSIGAIWSALLANALVQPAGTTDPQAEALSIVEQLAYQLRFREYRDFYLRWLFTKGLVKGDKFEEWLGTLLWNIKEERLLTFRDLPFDLTITATDALTGDSLLCSHRTTPDLAIARAVRASMSIQGFFKDITIDYPGPDGTFTETRCWDGGATGNCRFDVAYLDNPDRPVIASSVTYRGSPSDVDRGALGIPLRLPRIMNQTISILMRQFEAVLLDFVQRSGGRVLLIRPPLMQIGTFQLDLANDRKDEAIKAAREHALAEIVKFRTRVGV